MKKLVLSGAVLALLAACGGSNSTQINSLNNFAPAPTNTPLPTHLPTLAPNPTITGTPTGTATATPTPPPRISIPNAVGRSAPGGSNGGSGSGGNGSGGNGSGGGNGQGGGGNNGGRPVPTFDPSRSTPLAGTRSGDPLQITAIRTSNGPVGTQLPRPSDNDLNAARALINDFNQARRSEGLAEFTFDETLAAWSLARIQGAGGVDGNFAEFSYSAAPSNDLIVADLWNHPDAAASLRNPNARRIGAIFANGQWRIIVNKTGQGSSPYSFVGAPGSGELTRTQVETALSGAYALSPSGVQVVREVVSLPGGRTLQLVQPASKGWAHHTVGIIKDSDQKALGYVNVGRPFVPSDNTYFQGQYRGQALGDVGGENATAEVNADVNFYDSNKSVSLRLQNSQLNGTAAPDLDFQDHLSWNSSAKRFEGQTGNYARFYGNQGEELGGQFQRAARNKNYQGVYGAVKQRTNP